MKKLFLISTLLLASFLAACGSSSQEQPAGGAQEATQGPANTPTAVVLVTPTSKPAPPTPTPKPKPSPTAVPTDVPTAMPTSVPTSVPTAVPTAIPTAIPTETPAQIESAPTEEAKPEEATQAPTETPTQAATPTPAPTDTPAPTETPAPAIADDMVLISAGPFTMGQDGSKPKNGPAHQVDLPAYQIDHFEVTNDDFAAFVAATGFKTYAETNNSSKNWTNAAEGKGNHPVVYVTWNDATAFCEWAGKRLPTEAEWEKAARSDDARLYPWGDDFKADNGNFYEGGIRRTTAVGSFPGGASSYGVEDMAGNVREWVEDDFTAYPGAAAKADPFFDKGNKVNRGGGWFDGQDGELVTTYNRNAGPPDTSANDDIGFRCARDAQ